MTRVLLKDAHLRPTKSKKVDGGLWLATASG